LVRVSLYNRTEARLGIEGFVYQGGGLASGGPYYIAEYKMAPSSDLGLSIHSDLARDDDMLRLAPCAD
jgi:hypothetical protein